jgi:hypothetical protein
MPRGVATLLFALGATLAGCDGGGATTGMPADAAASDGMVAPSLDGAGTDGAISPDVRLPDLAEAESGRDEGAPDADPAVAVCESNCAARSMIECPIKRECLTPCLREINGRCKNRLRALLSCTKDASSDDFICDPAGYPEYKPTFCPDEQAALAKCAETNVDPP